MNNSDLEDIDKFHISYLIKEGFILEIYFKNI
jgi:hypothetical protein